MLIAWPTETKKGDMLKHIAFPYLEVSLDVGHSHNSLITPPHPLPNRLSSAGYHTLPQAALERQLNGKASFIAQM